MKKLFVRMEWGGSTNTQWMMNHMRTGFFLMNFPNCKNVNKFFEGLDTSKPNLYKITITPMGKAPLGKEGFNQESMAVA